MLREEKVKELREIEVQYLSTMLAESIARLGYPVGCGVAPHEDATRRAAEALFDRFAAISTAIEAAVLSEQAKQEPVAFIETVNPRDGSFRKSLVWKKHPKPSSAWCTEYTPLYAAPVVQEKQEPVALMYEDVTAAGKPTGVYLLADKSFRTDPDVFPVFRAPVVQPDMVMVPREPTEAMLDAPEVRIDAPCFGCGDTAVTWGQLAEIYRAMVAAAEKEG